MLLFFLVVFYEIGFVVTPVLPGDSLLFARGAFAAIHLISFSNPPERITECTIL
jgi:membrane protein DedA with SNARE-associated domain